MVPMHIQSSIQASAPIHLKARTKTAPLSTGNIGVGSSATSLFAENGVIWAPVPNNNNLYVVGFNSLVAFQNWGAKISANWKTPFVPLDAAAYQSTPFSYQDYPGLRAGQDFWMYACSPTLAPMYMNALTMLNANPTGKAGPACKSLGTTCKVLTSSGVQNMQVAYLPLIADTSMTWQSMWTQGCSW